MRLRWQILFLILWCLCDHSYAALSEGNPSNIYVNCLQEEGQRLQRYRTIPTRDEGLEWACMQSYLWRTAAEREAPRNLSSLQVSFLQTLVGNPHSLTAFQLLPNSGAIRPITNPPATAPPPTLIPTRRPPSRTRPTPPPRRGGPATGRRVPPVIAIQKPYPPTLQTVPPTQPRITDRPNPRPGSGRRTKRNSHERLKRALAGIPRKEYRAMSDSERNAVHAALNAAKNSEILPPNVYDFVANLHTGVLANGAHGGPAFLPFHRLYILIMDLVICFFDDTDSVRLPFWDNTADNLLINPALSIMWHSSFAGQGNGFVNNGPFATWTIGGGLSIRRNVGLSGSLMSKANVDAILTQSNLADISRPTALPPFDLERFHGEVHGFVGGDMGNLNTATNDPVFFMHHAYIDCIWQQFRALQPGKGVDPSTDYPVTNQQYHRANDPIGIVPGMTNAQGLRHIYDTLSVCELPTCPNCGHYFNCVNGRCIPHLSNEVEECPSCPGNNPGSYTGYQNSYCVNRYCDTSEWAYIPVQITYSRPPDYDARGRYASYPVVSGRSRQAYDIYDPEGYTRTGVYRRRYSRVDRSARYTECGCRQGGASSGSVYVQSYGVNYDGYYREYAVVDRRYAISSNTAYVAVRNPRNGASQAYVNVFDDCGRLCRPTCWDTASQRWVPCTGAITLTTAGGTSRGYGDTYEDATYQVWNYDDEEFPSYRQNNIYLNYYCDYTGTWPWTDYNPRGASRTRTTG